MTTNWKLGLSVLAIATGLAVTATAQEARGPQGGFDFETLDADGSGEITAEDMTTLRDQRFAEVDTDGDGSVSREEFLAHAQAQAAERAGERFDALDADGDGMLSQDVLSGGRRGDGQMMTRMIDRFDADGSGGVSAEEFETAQAQFMQRGERGGRGDHSHGGDGKGRMKH